MIRENLSLGQIVKSIAGRDEGRYFFIVGFSGEDVLIANGRERKISKPKLKKVKHVKKLNIVDKEVKDLLSLGEKPTDASLREKIASYAVRSD